MITGTTVNNLVGRGTPVDWSLLPAEARADVEAVTGSSVIKADTPPGRQAQGLVTRLSFATGARRFLKGIPTDHALAPRYRAEAETCRVLLRAGLPVPRLRVSWQVGGWWLMAFDDVDGARHPNLTPGSPDISRALALLDRLGTTAHAAAIPTAHGFVPAVGDEFRGWRHLCQAGSGLDPWAARNLDRLVAAERFWIHYADGTTLLHADLGPDTMLLAERANGDVVIDWAYLHQGANWIDSALFLPHLIQAGHTPGQAEALMEASVAPCAGAPSEAITFFAIALTGYWERSSRLPDPPQAPRLRLYQARMADVGKAWIQHRTDWT